MTAAFSRVCFLRVAGRFDRNLAGVTGFPAGSYYSPLLDVEEVARDPQRLVAASEQAWRTSISGRRNNASCSRISLGNATGMPLAPAADSRWRYFARNEFFVFSDAWALTQMIAKWKPRRIIEVGSGFSSAAMLDAREHLGLPIELTFIEPYPDRWSRCSGRRITPLRACSGNACRVATSVFHGTRGGGLPVHRFLARGESRERSCGSFRPVLPADCGPVWFVHFPRHLFSGPVSVRLAQSGPRVE
jgi:hypothetical protein